MPLTLHLIRHCESLGNITALYSGTTDHPPTTHGLIQLERLGRHLVQQRGFRYTHVITSPLLRARKTGGGILSAIEEREGGGGGEVPEVLEDPRIQEQNFGSLEGRKWHTTPTDLPSSGFIPVESYESMVERVDSFLQDILVPILLAHWATGLASSAHPENTAIAIVAHGNLNRVLWKRLVHLIPRITLGEGVGKEAGISGLQRVEWRNTGYLEVELGPGGEYVEGQSRDVRGWMMEVRRVDCGEHLEGLVRTGGGVGSSVADEKQGKIDDFFKKQ